MPRLRALDLGHISVNLLHALLPNNKLSYCPGRPQMQFVCPERSSESCILQLQLGECSRVSISRICQRSNASTSARRSQIPLEFVVRVKLENCFRFSFKRCFLRIGILKGEKSLRKWIPICSTESNFTDK